jgi:hypothetical protein
MKPGYYWGRLKGDPVPMEPCKVQDDETVWFFMDEFHPMSVARLEFGPEIIPPTEERIEAEKLSFEQWDRHQREIWAARKAAIIRDFERHKRAKEEI